MIALIDNYDSFTYNLKHYIGLFDDVVVVKNSQNIDALKAVKNLKGIAISPGPSHPKNSLLSLDAIEFFKGKLPIFGVCLGMQAIGMLSGFKIRKAKRVMHGKTDRIVKKAQNSQILKGLPEEFVGVRYHSLVIDGSVEDFEVVAYSSSDGEIMAIENHLLGLFGLQFHPESYLSQFGIQMVKNFVVGVCGNA